MTGVAQEYPYAQTQNAEKEFEVSVFVVAERIESWDLSFRAEYQDLLKESLDKYKGERVAGGTDIELLEGQTVPQLVAIFRFDSSEDARRWYTSAEYQRAVKLRKQGATSRLVIVSGAAA